METWSLHDILQHTADVAVNISDIKGSVLDSSHNLVCLSRLTWFHQVVAGMYFTGSGQSFTNTNPVGHYHSLIAPVVTQNTGQQIVISHRIGSIHLVIGSHDGPRITLANGNFEATQIEFAGSTLADALVNTGAECLL